ncbi:hypothetical protein ACFFSY_03590 [Paenibacillus aurantiacus]|uniref:Radical SAM protein n=1 Tax=Paenibacillus aurantiacus TaxID=1936118 RepID=A0ABV5KKV3_9BACL
MFGLSFGNGVTLVHFEQQAARLFAASDNLDCRYVRALFKKHGTPVTQYIEANLSSIYDTAEDLIALGNELIAFYVTPASYRLCKRLTAILKQLDDRTRIVWFGGVAAKLSEAVLRITEADGCVKWEPEATLHTLLNTDFEQWPDVQGIACRESFGNGDTSEEVRESGETPGASEADEAAAYAATLDDMPSAWEEAASGRQLPVLTVRCADQQGNPRHAAGSIRTHSAERLKRDIELAAHASKQVHPLLTLEGFELLTNTAQLEAAVDAMQEGKHRAAYRAAVPLRQWEPDFAQRLAEAGVSAFELLVPMAGELDARRLTSVTEAMKRLKAANERMTYCVTLISGTTQTAAGAEQTAGLLRTWIGEGLIEAAAIRTELYAEPKEEAQLLGSSVSGPDESGPDAYTPNVTGPDARSRDASGLDPGELPIRINLPEAIRDVIRDHYRKAPEAALINGYLAYMTGNYPHQVIGGGVKHIGYTDGEWNERDIHRLGDYTGVNSAILFDNIQVNRELNSEYIKGTSAAESRPDSIYYDQDGVWKQANPVFNRLANAADRSDYYLSNAHQIVQIGEHRSQLQMNDFLHMEPIDIRQMSYRQAAELRPNADEVQFQVLDINSEGDLDAFLQDVDTFSREGIFRHGYEVQSYLVDSCRWSGAHQCRAKQLPRLFVDGGGQLSSCRGCAAIGDMHDSLDSLLTQAAVMSDQEQLLRGCGTCPIKDTCSKCTFLPDYMNRQQYCDIRRKHAMLHRYMQMVQLFKGLRKYAQALNGMEVKDVRISLPTCTHLYPRSAPMDAGTRSAVAETVFLFFHKESPIVFHAATQKILKLNEPLALLLEGLIVGADETELRRVLMDRYQADADQAAATVSQAMELFAREGCLQLPARAS